VYKRNLQKKVYFLDLDSGIYDMYYLGKLVTCLFFCQVEIKNLQMQSSHFYMPNPLLPQKDLIVGLYGFQPPSAFGTTDEGPKEEPTTNYVFREWFQPPSTFDLVCIHIASMSTLKFM
jgi:hypothetical protein